MNKPVKQSDNEYTGLILEDRLALSFEVLDNLPSMEMLENLSNANEEALRSLFFIGEFAATGPENDQELGQDIQRIEMKLNFLIGLFAEQLMLQKGTPGRRDVRITPQDISWSDKSGLDEDELILLRLFINDNFPKELVFCCRIKVRDIDDFGAQVRAIFLHASESSIYWLEKYIFKMHRRRVALTKRDLV